jgi:phosphatidylserine decarboxylase
VRLSVGEGQTVKLGETMGVLLFAGRADVYLPSGAEPGILSGQRVIGGETILGGGATPPG